MSDVRGYAEMAEVLRYDDGASTPTFGDLEEAADLLAGVAAALPDCPTCGGTGYDHEGRVVGRCPAGCDHGKVSLAQMAARWNAVESLTAADLMNVHWLDDLRSVHSPSPKEGT